MESRTVDLKAMNSAKKLHDVCQNGQSTGINAISGKGFDSESESMGERIGDIGHSNSDTIIIRCITFTIG
jgi:hypothetical protein